MKNYYVLAKSQFVGSNIKDTELRARLKQYNIDARRLSRFTQLALLGALPLKAYIQPNTGIYLGASFNSPSKFNKMFYQLMDNHIPSPLDFMANLNNAATFHLSQQFNSLGNSLFIAVNQQSCLQPFQLAYLDLNSQRTTTALVGWAYESPILSNLEGSYWWLLTSSTEKHQEVLTTTQLADYFKYFCKN